MTTTAIRLTLADRARLALYEETHNQFIMPTPEEQADLARRLLSEILHVEPREMSPGIRPHIVQAEGLQFSVHPDGALRFGEVMCDWSLRLAYPCPKCQTVVQISDSIHSLADLGRAMEWAETDVCERCRRR